MKGYADLPGGLLPLGARLLPRPVKTPAQPADTEQAPGVPAEQRLLAKAIRDAAAGYDRAFRVDGYTQEHLVGQPCDRCLRTAARVLGVL